MGKLEDMSKGRGVDMTAFSSALSGVRKNAKKKANQDSDDDGYDDSDSGSPLFKVRQGSGDDEEESDNPLKMLGLEDDDENGDLLNDSPNMT